MAFPPRTRTLISFSKAHPVLGLPFSVTRFAPGMHQNPGGGIEGVVNQGDFIIDSFHMPQGYRDDYNSQSQTYDLISRVIREANAAGHDNMAESSTMQCALEVPGSMIHGTIRNVLLAEKQVVGRFATEFRDRRSCSFRQPDVWNRVMLRVSGRIAE